MLMFLIILFDVTAAGIVEPAWLHSSHFYRSRVHCIRIYLLPIYFRLGLLDNGPIPAGVNNPMDALVEKLASSLMMPEDETDVIIMNHSVGVRLPSGKCVSKTFIRLLVIIFKPPDIFSYSP